MFDDFDESVLTNSVNNLEKLDFNCVSLDELLNSEYADNSLETVPELDFEI